MNRSHKTRTSYVSLKSISIDEILQMHGIFKDYYENTSLDIFMRDLSAKRGVFLIRRRFDNMIVGFSTFGVCKFDSGGRKVRGIFSGDTIVERDYWGGRSLNLAFMKRAMIECLRNPLRRQYWLLISKGYKTFLLLARNLPEYYPSPEGQTSHLRPLVEAYCDQLFPGKLDRNTMLLDFGDEYCRLKEAVAPITPALAASHRAISFFESVNPTWWRGTELPCIARLDLSTFLRVFVPQLRKASRPSSSPGSDNEIAGCAENGFLSDNTGIPEHEHA